MTPLIFKVQTYHEHATGIEASVLTRDEYRAAAEKLDRLWNQPAAPGDRLEIERLLRLIEPCDAIALQYLGKR